MGRRQITRHVVTVSAIIIFWAVLSNIDAKVVSTTGASLKNAQSDENSVNDVDSNKYSVCPVGERLDATGSCSPDHRDRHRFAVGDPLELLNNGQQLPDHDDDQQYRVATGEPKTEDDAVNWDVDMRRQMTDIKLRTFRFIRKIRASRVNKTCPELNNVTFTNEPPFDILGVPDCTDSVKPRVALYVPHTDSTPCFLNVTYLPNNETTSCFQSILDYNRKATAATEPTDGIPISKVVFVTHGFLQNFDEFWLHQMQRDMMSNDPGTAVIIVGWGSGAGGLFEFYRAASNTRYVGYMLYLLVKEMHRTTASGATRNGRQLSTPYLLYTHCVGHSLGAQACGMAGKHLKAHHPTDQFAVKWNRISALDPAGPLFANDVPYPFNGLNIQPESRLQRNDADYVDAIHTDGKARYLSYVPQYGTMETWGTVDFYPGTDGLYGHDQADCHEVFNIIACSHSRAWQLYLSTISNASCLAALHCTGDPHDLTNDQCTPISASANVWAMGYWWDPNSVFYDANDTATGEHQLSRLGDQPTILAVNVSGQAPFCVHPYLLRTPQAAGYQRQRLSSKPPVTWYNRFKYNFLYKWFTRLRPTLLESLFS